MVIYWGEPQCPILALPAFYPSVSPCRDTHSYSSGPGGCLDFCLCRVYLTLTACISLQAEQSWVPIALPACQPLASQMHMVST